METADDDHISLEEAKDRDCESLLSLSSSFSSIKVASDDEDNSDQKPSAKISVAAIGADNDETETDQSIISDGRGKQSEICVGDDLKAMIDQVVVHETKRSSVSSSAAAAASLHDKSQDSASHDEPDGKLTVHTALHPDTARRVVTEPQQKDVLFGRDRKAKNHSGNRLLRTLCDNKRRIYDLADRDDKTEITRSIVHEIKSSGGSFLKFNKKLQVWLEVGDHEARHKVAHVMRDGRPQPLGRLEPEMFPPVTDRN